MGRPAPPAAIAAMVALASLALVFACRSEARAPSGGSGKPSGKPTTIYVAPPSALQPVAAPAPQQAVAAPAPQAPTGQAVAAPAPQAPAGQAGAIPAPQGREHPAAGGEPGRERPDREREGGDKKDEEKKDEKPRKGIPVTNALVVKNCSTCHQDQGGGLLGRISFMRKTPEGWELSLKRMVRLQHLALTPEDARAIVRYLADEHGLARAEAERGLYEVERRIHWSEDQADKDLRATCGECHTLGRPLSERRDEKEWKLLKATHLAFFPLARFQAFRGEGDGMGGPGGGIDWESMTEADAQDARERRQRSQGPDQADKVLDKLAKDLPLSTPEWDAWQVNRRHVPLAGAWDLDGHEPSRGDLRGRVAIRETGPDEYETEWTISYAGAAPVTRKGKGLLYGGCSWRGRSQKEASPTNGESPELREVLLLSEDWNTLSGRIFTGEYNEIGADVTLRRRTGGVSIFGAVDPAVMIPSKGQVIVILGDGFPADPSPADFNLGAGVTITRAERQSESRVRLTLDVARTATRGARMVSFRSVKGPADVVLYDTVDYVKVSPDQGLSRVGGKMRPPQFERFEAVAMNRGPDDEPYTADDYAVKVVPARWSLEEFPVRENDDDAKFVGKLDPATGVFTPALDGPNPERRWKANNIGEVFVVATCTLNVQEMPPKPKKPKVEAPKPKEAGGKKEGEGAQAPAAPPTAALAPAPAPVQAPVEEVKPVVMADKEFRARGHLLVMVPIYVQWDRYVWDRR